MKRMALLAAVGLICLIASAQAQSLSPAEARAIAKEAYIYGFPIVDSYRILYSYFVDRSSPEYKARWNGEKPEGIKDVVRSETELAFVFYRTQLLGTGDIENVKAVQAGFKVQPLSAFVGKPSPPPPEIDFMQPISAEEQRTSLDFFKVLNFVLQFCPTQPSETELMGLFAKLDIGAGKIFNASAFTPEIRKSLFVAIATQCIRRRSSTSMRGR